MKKLLAPSATNPAPYPVGQGFVMLVTAWEEGQAAVKAFNENALAAENYVNWFNGTWIPQYSAGRDIPYDANPPAPPKQKWALITEDGNSFTFDLIDGPTGALVCAVPPFHRLPAPNAPASLMGLLVSQGAQAKGDPTIATVDVAQQSTDSAGNIWVRVQ